MDTLDLFRTDTPQREALGRQAWVLRGFALPWVETLLPAIDVITHAAPFRHMVTPGGRPISVALTNCGELGWTSDRRGYRYTRRNPLDGQPWPAMPAALYELAQQAAQAAGFAGFAPDACLINRYQPGNRLTLHQDRNEQDFSAPIVSISLGMSAMFLFGGHARSDRALRIPLAHGDIAVWGGEDRLRFHGVAGLRGLPHPVLGEQRINLTFRRAGMPTHDRGAQTES